MKTHSHAHVHTHTHSQAHAHAYAHTCTPPHTDRDINHNQLNTQANWTPG